MIPYYQEAFSVLRANNIELRTVVLKCLRSICDFFICKVEGGLVLVFLSNII